ncbi:unnamed protein product [Rhizophagus irregularis]|nr:unnamed protein product [Rhizophagus irregularis]
MILSKEKELLGPGWTKETTVSTYADGAKSMSTAMRFLMALTLRYQHQLLILSNLLNSRKMISKHESNEDMDEKNPYQPQDEKGAISSTSLLQINGLCYTFTTLLIQSLEFNSAEPMIERLEFERTELIVDNVDLEEIFEKYRSECENNLSG